MNQGTKKLLTTIGMSSTVLLAGLALNGQTSKAATQVSDNQVRVEAGDTYKSIAEANNLSVAELEQANGREVGGFDLIFPNEIVTLPSASAVSNNSNTNDNNANTDTDTNNVQAQETSSNEVSTQASVNTNNDTQSSNTASTSNAGAFKISYYDPAVLGSNMGYGGVAANLSVFPKGTQLLITLSNGTTLQRTVNDTGTFAYSNPQQLDVAMPNSAIPATGIDTATVQVIG